MKLIIHTFLLLIIVLSITACQDGSLSDLNVTSGNTTSENVAPVSVAGEDQNVTLNSLVTLDGSSSYDLNGDSLTYSWSIISKPDGSSATLQNETSVSPSFTVDVNGTYVVKLSVNDGVLDNSTSDLVKIQTLYAPVANAGVNQNVNTGSFVTLDGSLSSVEDGGTLTYSWEMILKPDQSNAFLSSTIVVKPTFIADEDGTYEIRLQVSDGTVTSEYDSVIITATTQNATPIANAGVNQDAKIGSLIVLDGSTSSDADNDTLTYKWSIASKPSASTATLSDATIVNPSFMADVEGIYICDLIVNDAKVESTKDSVTISITKYNVPPQANAGKDQYVNSGTLVTLDASLSSDADLDKLTYKWNMTSKPALSSAKLSSTDSVNPTFIADVAGTYVFSLIVNDSTFDSSYDYVTINVGDKNVAPVADAGLDQNIKTNTLLSLDASLSSDANLDPITYQWVMISKPLTSIAQLSSSTVVQPSFIADKDGAYVFQLIVNDGTLESVADYVTINAKTTNSIPTAKAGDNQNVITLSTVMLNGAESFDPDPNFLSYIWHIVSRPLLSEAFLSDPSKVNPTFIADKDGTYVVQLVVNDGITNSSPDTVIITANTINSKPIADAGVYQSVKTAAVVVVDASLSFDADHDPLTYSWIMVSKPDGSLSKLSNKTLINPTFTADVDGTYVLGVSVNDGTIESERDYTTVIATKTNSVPVANAGPDQNIANSTVVTLNGMSSSDADLDALSYKWTMISKPSLSNASLSSSNVTTPTFTADVVGAYVFELIVSDGKSNSVADYVTIDAN